MIKLRQRRPLNGGGLDSRQRRWAIHCGSFTVTIPSAKVLSLLVLLACICVSLCLQGRILLRPFAPTRMEMMEANKYLELPDNYFLNTAASSALNALSLTSMADPVVDVDQQPPVSVRSSMGRTTSETYRRLGPSTSSLPHIAIDVVSSGSNKRPQYMEAQQATWASHPFVRHFLAVTELDDYDPTCEERLIQSGYRHVADWCVDKYAQKESASWVEQQYVGFLARTKWLKQRKNPEAWICAQKRPIAGLDKILQRYVAAMAARDTDALPDYLILVDDDTYINLDLLYERELMTKQIDATVPYVAAGCRIKIRRAVFHYGGGGLVVSRETLKSLLEPIHCNNHSNVPTSRFCDKINESLIGEKLYFKEGMRLFELMGARAKADAFPEVNNWTKGFCFHSDHFLAIIIGEYQLSGSPVMGAIQGSEMNKGTFGDCRYVKPDAFPCNEESSISCHYQTPSNMQSLHDLWQAQRRDGPNKTLAAHVLPQIDALAGSGMDVKLELQPSPFINDSNDPELIRLSPLQEPGLEASSLQIKDDLVMVVGGYVGGRYGYDGASSLVQFFNVTSQRWLVDRSFTLPDGVAQTHQGIAFDQETGFLYVVSGQVGGGCSPATTRAIRIHVDTKEWQELPPLPMARYSVGIVIVSNPNDLSEAHLHVFGGALSSRDQSARNHWRLVLQNGNRLLDKGVSLLQWEELEPVIDGGTHGRALQYHGTIFYTAFCNLDQHVVDDMENMQECQKRAKNMHQDLHHTSDAGLTLAYATEFAQQSAYTIPFHWTRINDMPFPACHTGMTVAHGKAIFVGGGIGTVQTRKGSSPSPLKQIQIFDLHTMMWESTNAIPLVPTNALLHNMMVWADLQRSLVFGLRSNTSLLVANMSIAASTQTRERRLSLSFYEDKTIYLKETRTRSLQSFQDCLGKGRSSYVEVTTFLERQNYDVRLTWNHAKKHLQYPDVIAFPKTSEEVSSLVKCARRSGYHVCGQNGKHSFESDTCTYGVVVDVSKYLLQMDVVERDTNNAPVTLRLGAGLTLGQVAVLVEDEYGLTVPMGHCATVGITGLMLVGGQGILSRQYGLLSDYVSAVELVNASGQIIRATPDNEFADYLWLAKGGGSGVQHYPGIITSLELTALPVAEAPKEDSSYTIMQLNYEPTVDNAVKLLREWQNFYVDEENIADPYFERLTIEPWMYADNQEDGMQKKQLYLAVYFYGNETVHQQVFVKVYLPKIRSFLNGSGQSEHPRKFFQRYSALDLHKKMGGVRNKEKLLSGRHGWGLRQRWKGMSAVAGDEVQGDNAFRYLAEAIFEAKPYPSRRYAELKPLQGAIKAESGPLTDSAFGHRDALWWVLLSSFYHENAFSIAQMTDAVAISRDYHQRFVKAMGSSYAGQYAGYIDHDAVESPGRDLPLYYGKENAKRISDIKMHRDPSNLFRLYLPNLVHQQKGPIDAAALI